MTSHDVTTPPKEPLVAESTGRARYSFATFWDKWGITSVLVLLVLVAVATTPDFLAASNIQSILRESAYLGIVACAMTIVIINGAFDLSVGGQLALVSVVTLFAYGVGGTFLAIVAALAVGTACGMVNGVLVTALRVPPFVATLGMLFVFRGIAYLLTQDGPATLPFTEVDSPFARIGSLNVALVPLPFLVMIVVFALGSLLLRRTPAGRRVIAFGSSPVAARFSGVSPSRTRFFVFTIVGLAVGIATLTYITRVWTADGAAQDGFELRVITAAVLGGASLQGGRGSLVGTFSAVMLVTVLNDVLVAQGIEAAYQRIILGAVLIVALAIDGLRTRFAGSSSLRRSFGLRARKAV